MTGSVFSTLSTERRAITLAAIILLQALCAIFFIGDVVSDIFHGDRLDDIHFVLEVTAALALSGGVGFLMLELRRLLQRMALMATGLRAARGEIADLMDSFFETWGLTPSERDVALLILKGMDHDEIAALRGTAAGTVRAQAAHVYAKAKVDGKAQLFSVFFEELLSIDPEPRSSQRSSRH